MAGLRDDADRGCCLRSRSTSLVIGLLVGQRKILFRCDAARSTRRRSDSRPSPSSEDRGWGESGRVEHPARAGRPLILYFHGNAGGIDLRVERFRAIAKAGMGLLAIEYRGYASSTGSPSEGGLSSTAKRPTPRRSRAASRQTASSSSGVAWVWRCRRARRAPQGWRARTRLALLLGRRCRGGCILVGSGSRIDPRSVPQGPADRLGQCAALDRARDERIG